MSEDCVLRRDPAMAGQSQIQSSTHAVSMNRRIDRARELGNRIHEILAHARELNRGTSGNFLNFTKLGSGGEKLAIACNDQRLGIASERPHSIMKLPYARPRQAVGPVCRYQPNFKMCCEMVQSQVNRCTQLVVQSEATCACEKNRKTRL